MMGVLTLFTIYMEDNTMMVALEKDEAGVVSPKIAEPLFKEDTDVAVILSPCCVAMVTGS